MRQTDRQTLTKSLSAAGSDLCSSKFSAEFCWSAWLQVRRDSRPRSSRPRSILELSMVLVPEEEDGDEEDVPAGGGRRRWGLLQEIQNFSSFIPPEPLPAEERLLHHRLDFCVGAQILVFVEKLHKGPLCLDRSAHKWCDHLLNDLADKTKGLNIWRVSVDWSRF